MEGPTSFATSAVSPPLASQVLGVNVTGPADLLPSAEPIGTPPQIDASLVAVSLRIELVPHALSVKKEIGSEHLAPIGAPQAQGEHARVSSTPS